MECRRTVHPEIYDHDDGLIPPLDPGAAVRDRKRPAPWGVGTAVDILETPAAEFVVEAIGRTVAEDNPGYPADDPVVRVRWSADDETVYHFPRSRLVREAAVRDVPPDDLVASPCHAREFDAAENKQYIETVRDVGYVESVPTARETDAGLELIDGHKRRWVAGRAGLETVAVWVVDVDVDEAATLYAACHRDDQAPTE